MQKTKNCLCTAILISIGLFILALIAWVAYLGLTVWIDTVIASAGVFMLWHDDEGQPLTDSIQQAAHYYYQKYGHQPDSCLVPHDLPVTGLHIDGVTVAHDNYVLPDELHIGVGLIQQESEVCNPSTSTD